MFNLGSNGNTALYSPPALAGNSTGTWLAGPVIPNGQGATDAPAAVLTNGDVLFAVSPYMTNGIGNGDSGHLFNKPTVIDEYNPTTNTISVVRPDDSTSTPIPSLVSGLANVSCFVTRMLDLPNGQVLFTDESGQAYVYSPNAAPNGTPTPLGASRPVINNIKANADGSFTLSGTQINGLSEGASYGDDAQMASNYPIVQISAGGQTLYATTFNWSSAGVQTGPTPETVQFTLPAGVTLSQVTSFTVITNPGQGSDVIVGASGTQTMDFQNLAPVYDNVPAPLIVLGTPSNNTINSVL